MNSAIFINGLTNLLSNKIWCASSILRISKNRHSYESFGSKDVQKVIQKILFTCRNEGIVGVANLTTKYKEDYDKKSELYWSFMRDIFLMHRHTNNELQIVYIPNICEIHISRYAYDHCSSLKKFPKISTCRNNDDVETIISNIVNTTSKTNNSINDDEESIKIAKKLNEIAFASKDESNKLISLMNDNDASSSKYRTSSSLLRLAIIDAANQIYQRKDDEYLTYFGQIKLGECEVLLIKDLNKGFDVRLKSEYVSANISL